MTIHIEPEVIIACLVDVIKLGVLTWIWRKSQAGKGNGGRSNARRT